jgi:hypothetical protein
VRSLRPNSIAMSRLESPCATHARTAASREAALHEARVVDVRAPDGTTLRAECGVGDRRPVDADQERTGPIEQVTLGVREVPFGAAESDADVERI